MLRLLFNNEAESPIGTASTAVAADTTATTITAAVELASPCSASPCSAMSTSSPCNLADWATASTLIETADCEPTTVALTTLAKQQQQQQLSAGQVVADEDEDEETSKIEDAIQSAIEEPQTSATWARLSQRLVEAHPEQSAEEKLTEQLAAAKAENEQMRSQLDKMHTMLTSQVKLMNEAAASLTPPVRDKVRASAQASARAPAPVRMAARAHPSAD